MFVVMLKTRKPDGRFYRQRQAGLSIALMNNSLLFLFFIHGADFKQRRRNIHVQSGRILGMEHILSSNISRDISATLHFLVPAYFVCR